MVEVAAVDGRITLAGRVRTEEDRESAGDIAGDVDGVMGVTNHIQVADVSRYPSSERPPQQIPSASARRARRVRPSRRRVVVGLSPGRIEVDCDAAEEDVVVFLLGTERAAGAPRLLMERPQAAESLAMAAGPGSLTTPGGSLDGELGEAYAAESARLIRARLDLALAAFAVFMGVVVLLERRIPGHEGITTAYWLELAICLAGVVLTRIRRFEHLIAAIAASTASGLALVMIAVSVVLDVPADPVALGQVCLMTCLAVVLPWGWRAQLVLAGTSLMGFGLALPSLPATSPPIFAVIGVVTGATTSCAAAYFLERYRFEAFRQAAQLSLANALQRQEAEVSRGLLHVASTLSRCLGHADLLEQVNRLVIETLDCDWSSTFVFDDEERVFRFVANAGSDAAVRDELEHVDFPAESLPLFAEFRPGELVEMPEPGHRGLVPSDLMVRWGTASALLAPVFRDTEVIGFVAMGYTQRTGPFSPKQRRLALGIAHALTVGVDNERLIRDLRAANRLKSDFVSTMSHELRTPLNVILGYAEILREEPTASPDETRDIAARVRRAASELLELVNATLDLGRMESGRDVVHLESVDVAEVFSEVEAELESPTARPEVAVHWRNEAGAVGIATDRVKLKTILKNLAGNAVKYTERGTVEVVARRERGTLVLEVTDSGIGIEPQHLQAIFEMFRQVGAPGARSAGGVGLGLYIVRQLVDRLHGKIAVESTPGVGSRFTVRLPAAAVESAAPQRLAV